MSVSDVDAIEGALALHGLLAFARHHLLRDVISAARPEDRDSLLVSMIVALSQERAPRSVGNGMRASAEASAGAGV